jgi:hypothetical protein
MSKNTIIFLRFYFGQNKDALIILKKWINWVDPPDP